MTEFKDQYGPWALVAGGAQGIGEAYSRYAAEKGLNVIVLDVNEPALDQISVSLKKDYGVDCLAVKVDLSAADMLEQVIEAVADRAVGLMVYNAGIADVGPFYKADTGLEFEKKRLAVNVTGPLLLTYHYAKPMLARKAGGVVLMSSGAGLKGAPYYSAYSASKAYEIALAQALWAEFKPYNVDVLAVAGGMTLSTAAEGFNHLDTSNFQTPAELVDEAMEYLGKQPMIVSEENHRAGHEQMRVLPDEQVIQYLADHAVTNFLGGSLPEQSI
jgi:short-subunit dehydrogenase